MKAKLVNEAIKHLPGRKLTKKEQKAWEHRKEFDRIVTDLQNRGHEDFSEYTENYDVDQENLIITFNHNWSDDDYDCDVTMTVNFKGGQIHLSGTCTNESIKVPGPGYMVEWDYDQEQDEEIDLTDISTDDFIEQVNETMDHYCGNFSYFAQQEGSNEEDKEYCEGCGELEEDCQKCEKCGECENCCTCDEDDDEDEEDEDE